MLYQLASLSSFDYNYNVRTPKAHLSSGALTAIITIGVVVVIFALVCLWKVFKKAGRPGWAAIIPIYNQWVLFEISDKPGWWALITLLLGFIPVVGFIGSLVFYIVAMLALAKRFDKSPTFAIFGLVIFNIVGFAILAFSAAKYNANTTRTD